MSRMIATSQDYQRGYNDGLQKGERRGWEKGKEAAVAEVLSEAAQTEAERSALRHGRGEVWEFDKRLQGIVTAIKKLKKP